MMEYDSSFELRLWPKTTWKILGVV